MTNRELLTLLTKFSNQQLDQNVSIKISIPYQGGTLYKPPYTEGGMIKLNGKMSGSLIGIVNSSNNVTTSLDEELFLQISAA